MSNAQKQPEHFSPPRTLNDAATMIVKLGFALPIKEDLLAIRNVCGPGVLEKALAETLNGENLDESKTLLSSVLGATAPSTRKRLEAMGLPNPPTAVLAKIGKIEGSQFAQQVREASTGTNNSEGARSYIALTLALYQEEFDAMPTLSHSNDNPEPYNPVPVMSPVPVPVPSPAAQRDKPQPAARQEPVHHLHPVENDGEDAEEDKYCSAHVYGGGFALCFNATQNRSGRPTISLDAAVEIPGSGKKRKYNWADKITVQLAMQEMPLVMAVLQGKLPMFKGVGHGSNNDKWFTMENQQGKVHVSVFRKGTSPRGVPITAGNIYLATSMFWRQMAADAPYLDVPQIQAMIDRSAKLAIEELNGNKA